MLSCDIEDLIGGLLLVFAAMKIIPTDTVFGVVCLAAGIYLACSSIIYIPPTGV